MGKPGDRRQRAKKLRLVVRSLLITNYPYGTPKWEGERIGTEGTLTSVTIKGKGAYRFVYGRGGVPGDLGQPCDTKLKETARETDGYLGRPGKAKGELRTRRREEKHPKKNVKRGVSS